jgi:uncharacterized protein (DUF4213/DUF364 family)
MQIISDLINSLDSNSQINQVLVSAHWTAVETLFCGMASTIMSDIPHGEGFVKNAGSLLLMSAKELAGYAQSKNTLEASIGLACINSLIKIPNQNMKAANAFNVVAEKGIGKKIAIFGHFPNMERLRATSKSVSVFELSPCDGEFNLDKIPEILPDADVVVITSNTIINHTLDLILPHLNKNTFAMMVGPSTPLSPILFDYGISMLAGIKVLDTKLLFQSISQGAIFRQVQGVELITISK